MKKNIAVITGGNSSEYIISVQSAQQIIDHIDRSKFVPYRIEIKGNSWFWLDEDGSSSEIDKNDFTLKVRGELIHFDCALIMIHGTPGEDGKLQGYLDTLSVPYTSSDVLTSSLTFNKHVTKHYLGSFGVASAKSLLIKGLADMDGGEVVERVGLPCFVKPNEGGSSFGITKVKTIEQLELAVADALKEDDQVLVEEYLDGTEITCGVFKTKWNEYVFPVTEIVSKTEFFDYEAKYTDGMADEIIPARIPVSLEQECKTLSSKIYDILNCRGIVRVDYIHTNNNLNLLEVNTIPGMSRNSIIPRQIRAMQLSLSRLLTELIENSIVSE